MHVAVDDREAPAASVALQDERRVRRGNCGAGRSSSHVAAGASMTSCAGTTPSSTTRARSRAYFAMGNRCPSGSGSTKWSE